MQRTERLEYLKALRERQQPGTAVAERHRDVHAAFPARR